MENAPNKITESFKITRDWNKILTQLKEKYTQLTDNQKQAFVENHFSV